MAKILIRSGMGPGDVFDPSYVLLNDSIGNNAGNLIYAYGVIRALETEDTEIIPDYYRLVKMKAEEINEKYDKLVIPLADAFRPDFRPNLKAMARLVRQLTIPCVVIGVGLRAPFEPGLQNAFPFDGEVKEFVSAVLEKSATIGVRGEITAQYLTGLGFVEGRHHTVIGCPSMYTYGSHVHIRDAALTKESRVCVNSSILSPVEVLEFLDRTMRQIPDHYFLPQRLEELKLVYTGEPYVHAQKGKDIYPHNMLAEVYRDNRVRFMLNAGTWHEFLRGADLSVGGRLHGNIAATVAGTPCILIPHDARMRELTDYHSLTHVWASEINAQTDIFDLAARLDFHAVERNHEQNFRHYVEFLDQNDLNHIYKGGADPEEAPLDRRLKGVALPPPLETIRGCSYEEMVGRWQTYYPQRERALNKLQKEVTKLRTYKENAEREKEKPAQGKLAKTRFWSKLRKK